MKIFVMNPQLNNAVDEIFCIPVNGIEIHKTKAEFRVYAAIEITDIIIMIAAGAISTIIGNQISGMIDKFRETKFRKMTTIEITERVGCMKLVIESDEQNRFNIEVYSNMSGDSNEYLMAADKFVELNKERIIAEKDIYAIPRTLNTKTEIKYDYKIRFNQNNTYEVVKRAPIFDYLYYELRSNMA